MKYHYSRKEGWLGNPCGLVYFKGKWKSKFSEKRLVNERKPDIVVFTGDLIDKKYELSSEEQEKLIKELKGITATLGKYAILGDEDNEKISTIFNQSDFTILRNEYDLIYN